MAHNNVTVWGAGAWGTALATLLADAGYSPLIWSYEQAVANDITNTHTNARYTGAITLHPAIGATTSMQQAAAHSTTFYIAIPVVHLQATLTPLRSMIDGTTVFVVGSKGMQQDSLRFASQIIEQDLDANPTMIAVLAGGSFAHELIAQRKTHFALACDPHMPHTTQQQLIQQCTTPYTTIHTSTDLMGVQLLGVYKNIMAINAGIIAATYNSKNMYAAYITQSIALIESMRYVSAPTLYSAAGIGDIVASTTSTESKNFRFGTYLAQGYTLSEIKKIFNGQLPEGYNSVYAYTQWSEHRGHHDPYALTLEKIIENRATPADLADIL